MQNDQSKSGTQSGQKRQQSDLEQIIRGAGSSGKFGSQSDANTYLQQHGLSVQMKDDGSAEVFDSQNQNQKVATIQFQGSDKSNRQISNISYQ